ncbi:GNAT family N-acetyltransferase [Alicyclobacillus sp. ALC3]|nr:GNAT family N-acetyltransferase [Alicyclobacillus sp. ALC3]
MELETGRLLLRPYTMDDLDFFASLWEDPEVVRYIGEGVTRTRAEAEDRLRRIMDGYASGYGLLAMWHTQNRRLVGHAGLVRQEVDGKSEIELGYWLARDSWGHGLATEAAVALRDHAFNDISLHRIISLIQPANAASIAVAERVGMKLEREATFKGQAVCVYSMLPEAHRSNNSSHSGLSCN